MRCPPVSLTSGTLYFTATSAIRFSSSGVQTPPGISGMTEKVPSFWMLPCIRSLMNLASRSSSYSLFQIIDSSTARPGLLPGSSLPPASTLKTDDTDFRPLILMASISSSVGKGTPGT